VEGSEYGHVCEMIPMVLADKKHIKVDVSFLSTMYGKMQVAH
jgi:hypothetical protein